jgi:hypothetical protein
MGWSRVHPRNHKRRPCGKDARSNALVWLAKPVDIYGAPAQCKREWKSITMEHRTSEKPHASLVFAPIDAACSAS